jgi:hypothetical protein
VEKALVARGLELSDNPDLRVHYHAAINRRLNVSGVDRARGYCYSENCQAEVSEYEAGTLVIDIVDTKTNRVIWRGWAQDAVGEMLEDRDVMARTIDESVTRMLARLPLGRAEVETLAARGRPRDVGSYEARGIDFARYGSYGWAAADRLSTGDPRLDNNPFFERRLKAGVDRQLAGRGLEQGAAGAPDLVVHYHASVSQRIDLNGIDREFARCEAEECQPFVYEAGTIVLDLVDARTNTLVWRGWAKDSLDGVIDDQSWLEQKVDQAVTRIMATLPRALSSQPGL